tara:strand:- start:590 stop:958 length:369 start_codon:yes stop_codon:yes gene_type:complete
LKADTGIDSKKIIAPFGTGSLRLGLGFSGRRCAERGPPGQTQSTTSPIAALDRREHDIFPNKKRIEKRIQKRSPEKETPPTSRTPKINTVTSDRRSSLRAAVFIFGFWSWEGFLGFFFVFFF